MVALTSLYPQTLQKKWLNMMYTRSSTQIALSLCVFIIIIIENFLPTLAGCTGQAFSCSSLSWCASQVGCYPLYFGGCGGSASSCSSRSGSYSCSSQLGCYWSDYDDDYGDNDNGNSRSGLGWRAIAGIVVGVLIVLILIVAAIIVICVMNRRSKKASAAASATPTSNTTPIQQEPSSKDIEDPNSHNVGDNA
jgi:uncharacterized membrane protein